MEAVVFFMAILYTLRPNDVSWPLGAFCGCLEYFYLYGMLDREKFGNPALYNKIFFV
jgi:hypothetical protein